MKKLLLLIAALFSFLICFGFKSYAYNAPSGGDYKYYYTFTTPETSSTYATTYEIWSDAEFGLVYSGNLYYLTTLLKDTNGNYKVTTFQGNNNYKMPYTASNFGYSPNTFGTPDYTQLKQPQARLTIRGSASPLSDGRVLTVISSNQSLANNAGIATYSTYQSAYQTIYSDYLNSLYDWDNPLYSANIGAPRFDVTYRELSSTPIVDVPLDVSLTFPPSTVYVEMDAIFDIPVDIYAGSYQGNYEYNVEDTVSGLFHIIDKEDLVLASNASTSYIHLALVDVWEEIYNDIPISEINWRWPSDYSASLKSSIQARYENLRKICCFYGNEVKLFVRYFTIANDTQFVVGSWRIWDSTSPNKFTDQMPTWYEPYIPASGTTGTSSNTGSNTEQDPDVITIPTGSGDPTGIYYNPTTNITVGSNVPNYPDYPTIRSYNADNFLVQTMNYLDYFNDPDTEHDLFGEFGGFLKTVFVFIPGEIWSIIAVGFCLVIVVMFLKIL